MTVQAIRASAERPAVVDASLDDRAVTEKIAGIPLWGGTPLWWLMVVTVAFGLVMVLLLAVSYLFLRGVGIWGIQIPVGWGFAIVNFVWWIGIGHAGTLISAVLLLLHQQWRTSINRFAEAMTLFAVACAGLFPLLHLGRPWRAYFILPYPNVMGLWPQWRSPLVWDVFAISTYGTVSLLFWYLGLVPDLATMRDRAKNIWVKRAYGVFALGWRGASRHWHHYTIAYLLLAGLATPLVVSVHSIVSADFAAGIIPGWHSTIFPPYFVAGAIFSGFAMVLTLLIPLRALLGLHAFVTQRHLENMAWLLLVTGLVVTYGYAQEHFMAWYSGNVFEWQLTVNRAMGVYAVMFWAGMVFCNVLAPQILWFRRARVSPVILFVVSILVNIGMWVERYVIVIVSLHRDYLPSSWRVYAGTIWDWGTYLGTIGLFLALFFLFVRLVPMISMSEMRELLHEKRREAH